MKPSAPHPYAFNPSVIAPEHQQTEYSRFVDFDSTAESLEQKNTIYVIKEDNRNRSICHGLFCWIDNMVILSLILPLTTT